MTTRQIYAVPAIPEQRRQRHPAMIEHPEFCERRRCTVDDTNVSHRARPDQWCAAESDTRVTIGLEQVDEFAVVGPPKQLVYPPVVRIHFEDTASIYRADRVGQEFAIAAEACLDASDCRHLAGQLLALADQLDKLGGA